MKQKYLPWLVSVLLTVALLLPIPKTTVLSGTGAVLNTSKEKIGSCALSIEIRELRSLTVRYRKSFSFTLNGNEFSQFETAHTSEADDLCLITQLYYDVGDDCIAVCSLTYPKDLSYMVLFQNGQLYFLPNGTNISYSEIPFEIIP